MLCISAAIPINTVPMAPPIGVIIKIADAFCVRLPKPLIDKAKIVGNIIDSKTKIRIEATKETPCISITTRVVIVTVPMA